MVGLLNIGSIIFGLIAWVLPVMSLMRVEKDRQQWVMFSLLSVISCSIALCFQILYHNHLVNIEDWSAMLDITPFITFASCVLLVVTIILNLVTYIVYRKRLIS